MAEAEKLETDKLDKRSREYKIKVYGSMEAYSEEMKRRRAHRKDYSTAHKFNSYTAKKALAKRRGTFLHQRTDE